MDNCRGSGRQLGSESFQRCFVERLIDHNLGDSLGPGHHRLVPHLRRGSTKIGAVGSNEGKPNAKPERRSDNHRNTFAAAKIAVEETIGRSN